MEKTEQKRILVFGDSNTWGWRPDNNPEVAILRWSDEERWTGVMQNALGDGYQVITEGLNARTTVWDDPIEEHRCGKEHLLPVMDSQAPFDLLIIFLGSNDLKCRFTPSAWDIAQSVGLLAKMAENQRADFRGEPKLMIISPPRLNERVKDGCHANAFLGSMEKSKELAVHYEKVASLRGAAFLNADAIIKSSDVDGLHLDLGQHEILGRAAADMVRNILKS